MEISLISHAGEYVGSSGDITYMFIAGWGIFLIFTANQATALIVGPYPPFGLATLTVLNMGAIFDANRNLQFSNTCFS